MEIDNALSFLLWYSLSAHDPIDLFEIDGTWSARLCLGHTAGPILTSSPIKSPRSWRPELACEACLIQKEAQRLNRKGVQHDAYESENNREACELIVMRRTGKQAQCSMLRTDGLDSPMSKICLPRVSTAPPPGSLKLGRATLMEWPTSTNLYWAGELRFAGTPTISSTNNEPRKILVVSAIDTQGCCYVPCHKSCSRECRMLTEVTSFSLYIDI